LISYTQIGKVKFGNSRKEGKQRFMNIRKDKYLVYIL